MNSKIRALETRVSELEEKLDTMTEKFENIIQPGSEASKKLTKAIQLLISDTKYQFPDSKDMNETIEKSIQKKAKELHNLIERARSEGLDVKFKHITNQVSSDDKIEITVRTQRVLCKSSI